MKSIIYELTKPCLLEKRIVELKHDNLKETEVLAETQYSVVSTGTEIAAWMGKPPLRGSSVYPRLIGYCNLAKVLKKGEKVKNIAIGDYIITHQSHRSAFICDVEDILLKANTLEENHLKKLTATYLYHLGYTALLAGNYTPGHYVAIVGMGAIGIATASLINAFGMEPYIFTDQCKEDFAFHFSKDDKHISSINKLCRMDGVDIVINTSNQWKDYLLSLKLARKGGKVVCIGFPGRGEEAPTFNPLDPQYFYDKQLVIKHCGYVAEGDLAPIDNRFTLKRNMHYLAGLIEKNLIDPFKIIEKEFHWQELDNVYQLLTERNNGLYSAIINWKAT